MSLFKKTIPIFDDLIGDPLNGDPTFPTIRGFIEGSWMYGSFRTLSKPSMLWFNGATYSLWYKEQVNNNQVGIFKQIGDSLESTIVNTGTVTPEPINHPAPMLHINKTTGFIYVLQNRTHVDTIRVWKSQSPENINGFNYIGEFGAFTSYLGHLEGDESDIVIQTRAGTDAINYKDHSIIKVNLDTLVYTQTQLTTIETSDTRHYLIVPYQYGTSTRIYFGIGHRNDAGSGFAEGYFKFSLLVADKIDNYDIMKNIDNSFSKNVVSSGVLTIAEMETNFSAVGSDSARNTIISEGKMIVLNDDIYLVWMSDDAASRFSVRKFTYGSASFTDFLIPVTTIAESPIWYGPVYMRYNGVNFVFTIAEHDGVGGFVTKVYGCSTVFTNWTEFNVDTLADGIVPEVTGYFYGMPTNLNDAVNSNEKYLMIGRDLAGLPGEFIFTITTKKWLT